MYRLCQPILIGGHARSIQWSIVLPDTTYGKHDPLWVWTFSRPANYANLAEVVVGIREQNLLQ